MDIGKILDHYHYDKLSGHITKKEKSGRWPAGRKIGWVSVDGYVKIRIFSKHEYAHRLAWAMHYGVWPDKKIDHVNRNRSDNRLENLRLASDSQNCANQGLRSDNTSGKKGVTWNARRGKWQAQIQYKGKRLSGLFRSIEEASDFYDRSAASMCDEYFSRNS